MTSTTQKYRALFLSALMVISVVAVTVSFSGAAVANHNTSNIDDTLGNGQTYWQGEVLNLTNSSWTGTGFAEGDTYQIRTADDANNLVRERTAERDGHTTVDTSGLNGNYNVTFTTGAASGDTPLTFEVAVQDFNTTFNDTTISTGDHAGVEVESNRGTFNVTVSATGLDEDDLNNTFASANPIPGEDSDDGVVEMEINGGETIPANFSGIAPGEYTFEFEVVDTDATSSATITVSELDVTADFDQNVYEEEAGDVAEITVELDDTDETWIIVGGEESGWIGGVQVQDADEDGEVTVMFNSYLAGQAPNNLNGGVFTSEEDDITGVANANDFNQTWANGDLEIDVNTNLTVPIEGGDYDLRTASSADMADDGTVTNENDVATLILNERSTTGATVYTAPAGAADADDLSELRPMLSQQDSVRLNDRVVIAYEVSGVYGLFAAQDPMSVLTDYTSPSEQAVNLFAVHTNPGSNRDPAALDLSASDAEVMVDAENNTFYLVLNTNPSQASTLSLAGYADRDLAAGQEWTAALYVGDDGENFFGPNESARDYANYVEDGEMEVASGSFSLETTTGSFDNINVDDQVQVLQDEEAVVSGETNIAPGSEVSVRLRASGDSPFLKTKTVEVGPNGTWSAEFDMSDVAVGQEFTATLRTGATTLADEDAIVVDEIEDPSEERTVVVTRTVVGDTPTPRVETREVTREVEVTRTVIQERTVMVTQTTGQPGFGIAVAIVALLAAALLAVRRRD